MLQQWIKRLLSPEPAQPRSVELLTLAPAGRFFAIGDIHGRFDLLQVLLEALDDTVPLIFLGDYVDRGDSSAQVLRHLHHHSTRAHSRAICLKGNHEEMLLGFLEDPAGMERIWMHNGGIQTLASFGVTGIQNLDAAALAEQLRHAMGESLLDWLRDRPVTWTQGNITAVHGALDPAEPFDGQQDRICLWGHPNFPDKPRKDGQWVVHGHSIVDEPRVQGRVISIDTGAFATNQLTAAEISDGGVQFISTSRDGIIRSTVSR